MPTNPYFNTINNRAEQLLIDGLINESIRIYGQDIQYLPRTGVYEDNIFNEVQYSSFNDAIETVVYVESAEAFAGDGELLSKWGMEVRDQLTLQIAVTQFAADVIPYASTGLSRPNEGDLIYVPVFDAVYEIRHVENSTMFFQFGKIQALNVTVELFEYAHETFNTGISLIDDKYSEIRIIAEDYAILLENGNILANEAGGAILLESYNIDLIDINADNEAFQDEVENIIDWSEDDPFSDIH